MLRTIYKNVIVVEDSSLLPNVKTEMHSVPVSPHVMKLVGLDLCSLPETDGYCHLIVCIDYFTKGSEAKPVRDKTALTVAMFLYELMCCHACFEVQINNQGREFINCVYNSLHDLTSVEEHITVAYHPQSSCGEAKQNDKECLCKSTGCISEEVTAYH